MCFDEEDWEIPLPHGRANFENMFKSHVTMVERSAILRPATAGLQQGVWGNLDSDKVALLVRTGSDLARTQLFESVGNYQFLGKLRETDSGWIVQGAYRTQGWFRQYKLAFSNAGFLFAALGVVVIVKILFKVLSEDAPTEYKIAMTGVLILSVPVFGAVAWLVTWSIGALNIFERKGNLLASAEIYRLLKEFAGSDNIHGGES